MTDGMHCRCALVDVEAVDKKRAHLNCITHLLSQLLYGEVERGPVQLPERVYIADYLCNPVPTSMIVPSVY